MKFLKIRYLSKGLFPISYFLFPLFALADLPAGNAVTLADVDSIVRILARFLITMSAIAMVVFIVLSGIMTMLAQADPGKFTKGMLRLKHAVYGAAVVLATGVIINTVAAVVDRSFFCQISILGICLY
ncbi:MAG: hypothetical protein A2669_02385 [Candidatus Yanofskybacteria bacterium RIFCSPHIGHO2_01_FULL_48_25b]|uniref:Uncharacterized protein n=1 Tax=Candidatus Yanofskybacteria bacterium RIFCSPHIGHO2_01_FULL_48_25b TaxID=1802672 RepID=A0A1F8F1Q7_9BACT|nr:MAG: hypothetical protein A2669_02385 [Candidatus Yanofskybacteria bacterium RIFCSPHIGHO2_01_FULL_48_25b]